MFLTCIHPIVRDPFPEILIHLPFWLFCSASLSSISYLRRLWMRETSIYGFLLSFGTIHSQRLHSYRLAWHLKSCPLLHLWLFTFLKRKQGKYHIDFHTLPIHVSKDAILEICVCTVIVTWLRENHNKKIYLWSFHNQSPLLTMSGCMGHFACQRPFLKKQLL